MTTTVTSETSAASKRKYDDFQQIVFTETVLQQRVKELAKQISKDYADKDPLIVGVLTGAVMFTVDLVRHLKSMPHQLDFISVSSYGNTTESSGHVVFTKDFSISPAGRHVIIVEDIIDTGNTLDALITHLYKRIEKPKSVKICALLNKTSRREKEVPLEYVGFELEDGFIVGYGLDYAQRYRHLPFLAILKPQIYEKS